VGSASNVLNLFIDDGGVMNDNAVRSPQWHALVGEFFAPRLGGTLEAWAEANRIEVPKLWDQFPYLMGMQSDGDFDTEWRAYELAWLRTMCESVGMPSPEDEDESLALSAEAALYVIQRVRSAYPGAVGALRTLAAAGFNLYTASNETSFELDAYLRGMEVRDLFLTLYGSDLVKVTKSSVLYHDCIFANARVDPRTAIVVDDKPACLAWAAGTGARTVLVSETEARGTADAVIGSLAELPAVLDKLGWK
jgi:phosphoglycolate phosphatase-like HAD superfamily hydrolase